jgi:hypothetical protein
MSLTVTQRPIHTAAGETSKWNEVGNPILYKMQRKDFSFNQINNAGGFVQLQFTGINLTSSFANGDELYVLSDNAVYDAFGLQTAEAFSAGNTLITTDIPYTLAATTGFVNNDTLRKLYRVDVEIYDSANVIIGVLSTWSPTAKGALSINVSPGLKPYLNPEIAADLTLATDIFEDVNGYKVFYIKYREVWTGSAEAQTDDVANKYRAVLGARQIPAPYGGNLYEYVTFEDGSPKGLFLTKFSRPKMWRGYPFVLSAILGDNITGNIYFSVAYYDISGGLVSSAVTAFTTANNGKLIIVDVTQILAIPSTAVTMIISASNLAIFDSIINSFTCDIVDPCDNPVMLLGRNSLGGVMQFMFDFNQELSHDLAGTKAKRLTLVAEQLTSTEWYALQDFISLGEVYKDNILELTSSVIKTSTRIGSQVYVIDSTGVKLGVLVIPTKNLTKTSRVKHNFELTIEYPEELTV